MYREKLAIGQKMLYTYWDTRKECIEESEVEIVWIYNNETAEVKILDKVYKVELVKCSDLKMITSQEKQKRPGQPRINL